MSANDYAVVIGVTEYSHFGYLSSVGEKAHAFLDWLVDANGGGIPRGDVVTTKMGDTASIDAALGVTLNRPVGSRRFYLYVAGLGTGDPQTDINIFPADFSTKRPRAIALMPYVEAARRAFTEVVVVAEWVQMDKDFKPMPIPGSWAKRPPGRPGSLFYAFSPGAVPALTTGVLDGLRGAAAAADGAVTTLSLVDYLRKLQPLYWLFGSKDFVLVPPRSTNPPPPQPPPTASPPTPTTPPSSTNSADRPTTSPRPRARVPRRR